VNSCELTPACQVALADLACSILIEVDDVNAGETFQFSNMIDNVKEITINCETAGTGQTSTKMDVAYKENEDGDYNDITTNNFFTVPPIDQGKTARENYEVQFTTPGYYKITTYADGKFQEDERSEGNNEAKIVGEGKRGSSDRGIVVTVKDSKKRKVYQNPKMIILNHSVTID
jgi:hypothetical protein